MAVKETCPHGHVYDDENSYIDKRGYKHCKTCRSERMRERRKDNPKVGRGTNNSSKTHCPKGHPYDSSNTTCWRNKRICKACAKLNADWQRLRKYGLDKDSYEDLLKNQENLCVICAKEFVTTPHIDHDHETGEVRGLLCYPCNSGLGQFEDDIDRLKRAIKYLTK
jgi:hypothetical protein